MAIFASINRWHLNSDEFPYLDPDGTRRSNEWVYVATQEAVRHTAWVPRVEFTPVTAHAHNEILQTVRDGSRQFSSAAARREVMVVKLGKLNALTGVDVTPEVDHARRVLARLLGFSA
jgi:hypothetical protein